MILLLIGVISAISHVITKPIKDLCAGIDRMSNGDLTTKIRKTSNDEIGEIGEKFNIMTERLLQLVNKIQETAETLSVSSQELALTTSTNLEIAQGISNSSL